MWTLTHRLLRCSNHIFNYKKSDAINAISCAFVTRGAKDDSSNSISKLFQPATIKEVDANNIGVELTGKVNKTQLLKVLKQFSQKKEISDLCKEYGLDGMYEIHCKVQIVLNIVLSNCMESNEPHIFIRLHSSAVVCELSPVLL